MQVWLRGCFLLGMHKQQAGFSKGECYLDYMIKRRKGEVLKKLLDMHIHFYALWDSTLLPDKILMRYSAKNLNHVLVFFHKYVQCKVYIWVIPG